MKAADAVISGRAYFQLARAESSRAAGAIVRGLGAHEARALDDALLDIAIAQASVRVVADLLERAKAALTDEAAAGVRHVGG